MKVVNRMKAERSNSGRNIDQAEHVGTAAFTYLANDTEAFSRFASITGIELSNIAEVAGTANFLSGVLEFFMGDEALLLSFGENSGIEPEFIQQAHKILSANTGEF